MGDRNTLQRGLDDKESLLVLRPCKKPRSLTSAIVKNAITLNLQVFNPPLMLEVSSVGLSDISQQLSVLPL